MGLILAVIAITAATRLAMLTEILVVHALASLWAAFFYWRCERLRRAISNSVAPKQRRRMLARHLQLSIDMSAHFSLFPYSAARGYALARTLVVA